MSLLSNKYESQSAQGERGVLDLTFLLLVLTLLVFGLVMMFSASYANAYYYEDNSFHYISRQLVFAVIGIAALVFFANIDYHVWRRFAWVALIVSMLLLLIVFTQRPVNKAHRWIWIGSFSIQPTEIAKFAMVLFFAHLIDLYKDKMNTFRYGILPFGVILVALAGLIIPEPHLSATVLIFLIAAIMLFVGGLGLKWYGIGVVGVGALATVAMMIPKIQERAMYRIEIWQNPFIDPQDAGFQTIQSLYAIGSGGLLGAGIGNSRQKYLFLPEPQNDFVFAIVCEELGFIGAVLVLLLFALLIWRGFSIALKARDTFGTMLATGLTAQVGLQAILNVAVVTNTVPNTGISLPFFSYGGTSLLMLLAQMGVILSVSRYTALEKT
ncbi:MAG: putative lipid II flippase FtsW [Angelakisella sp.]